MICWLASWPRVSCSNAQGVLFVLALAAVLFPPCDAVSPSAAPDFQWQALGWRTSDNNCSGCHQRSGRGISGGFPPLAGHVPDLLAEKGRGFLARLVLFGMSGGITVEGTAYNGNMPSWEDSLKDDEIAAVIDYVLTSWGNDKKLATDLKRLVPAEMAAARPEKLGPEQVYAMRTPGAAPSSQAAQAAPSFTEDQAERGHLAYAHNCLDCHGSNLDNGEFGGPPLKGLSFARHWDASNVAALFSFMKAKMPPDRPGGLN